MMKQAKRPENYTPTASIHYKLLFLFLLLLHQIGFEISKVFCHRYALLLTAHKCCQTLWYLYVDTQYLVNLLLEFCWVSSLAEHACLAILQSILQCLI